MPSRKALEAGGRGDLVRGVLAAGGFLAVAQELGLRARRKPQGYWDSSENLEQVRALAGAHEPIWQGAELLGLVQEPGAGGCAGRSACGKSQ